MAMYYYARKLQKGRRPKTLTSGVTTAIANGGSVNDQSHCVSSPSTSSSSDPQLQLPSTSRQHLSSSVGINLSEESSGSTGSIEALIRHLVPTDSYYPDRAFTFAFLLASRLHIPPHEVLGRVFSLTFSEFPSPPDFSRGTLSLTRKTKSKQVLLQITSNLIHLLGEWTQLFPYDFRDERMMVHVRAITEKSVQLDSEPIRQEVSHLLTTLLGRLTGLERHEFLIHRLPTENAMVSTLTTPSILTICPSSIVLAQQLTHIELEYLAFVGPEEFVHDFLKESSSGNSTTFQLDANTNTKSYSPPKKIRNLISYLYWHTRLRFYVATEVCKISKKKSRLRIIEYWIETARECFNIGNFNSLMAIIMAFNMSPLERLKKTWEKVNSVQLQFLNEQMNPSNNYTNYRFILQSLVPGALVERQKILIPFMSLLVKDLCFLSQECAAKLANGQINFEKFWQLAKQVTEFMTWQQVSCSFPKVQSVISSLQMPPVLTERELNLASYECEPPTKADERENYKTLLEQQGIEQLSNGLSNSFPTSSENPHSSTTTSTSDSTK